MNRHFALIGAVGLIAAIVAGIVYANWNKAVPILAMAINYVRYLSAPAGTMTTELAGSDDGVALSSPASSAAELPGAGPSPDETARAKEGDWPSYNKTLTSNRFSQLSLINKDNVSNLRVICTYDTGQYTGFTAGLLEVNGAVIGTTEYDIFSIDPTNCRQNWRTHEEYTPATPQGVNRGAAYMDGQLFRGTQDGRVLAYDVKTGKRLWETTIADAKKGESVPCRSDCMERFSFYRQCGRRS